MKYLVTGGAGFIGSNLTDRLINDGHKVIVIDNLSTGKREHINNKALFFKIDIQDNKLSIIFKKERPDIVFHLAAQISVRYSINNPISSAKTNIIGSLNVMDNCRRFGVKKIIFASSGGAIYGEAEVIPTPEKHKTNPLSPYGIEKLSIENYLAFYKKLSDVDFLILRLSNVYGPRQNSKGEGGVVAIFLDNLIHGKKPTINGSGGQTRDFVFIDDVVNAFALSAKKGVTGIYNIGTGNETDIKSLFEKVRNLLGSKMTAKYGHSIKGDQKRSCLSVDKAKKLGFKPRFGLEEGLKLTADWFLANG